MTIELKASQVREQIALTMPHVLKPDPAEPSSQKKTKPSKVLGKLQRERQRRHRHHQ